MRFPSPGRGQPGPITQDQRQETRRAERAASRLGKAAIVLPVVVFAVIALGVGLYLGLR